MNMMSTHKHLLAGFSQKALWKTEKLEMINSWVKNKQPGLLLTHKIQKMASKEHGFMDLMN